MNSTRRHTISLIACSAAAPAWVAAQGRADALPGSMRIVEPFPPGAAYDAFARKLAEKLAPRLGASLIVDSKPGAVGTIAAMEVRRAQPDAGTLLLTSSDPLVSVPVVMKVGYNARDDFTPICKLMHAPSVLMLSTVHRMRSLAELAEDARTRKDPLPYATFGVGTFPHLVVEAFARKAGVRLSAVPYRGSTQAVQDLMAGEVALAMAPPGQAMTAISQGKARALAVVNDRRAPTMPDVPTFAEAGFDGFFARRVSWAGLFGPAKMNPAVVERIVEAVHAALQEPDLLSWMKSVDLIPNGASGAQFRQELDQEVQAVTRFIRDELKVQPQDLADGPR